MRVEPPITRPIPALGAAPARMVSAARVQTAAPDAATTDEATGEAMDTRVAPAVAFRWIGKRLAIWFIGSIFFATAFHFTGFIPLGVVAILFPIVYWVAFILEWQMTWGIAPREKDPFADMRKRKREQHDRETRIRMFGV